MSEIELKACPFCGGREFRDFEGLAWSRIPECRGCGARAMGPFSDVRRNPVDVWNTRASQWQPIESAPKDGTAVLVMQNNWPGCKNGVAEECNGHNTYVAAWWADERGGAGAWICYMDAFRDPECPIQPTHWQPMPHPPGVEG